MQIKNSGATSSQGAGVPHGTANMEAPHVWLASEVIGMEVESKSTEHLGKIVDVVIHADQTPSYAVLSFGGWLGMGDKLFAMPWSVLGTVQQKGGDREMRRKLVLGVDKERLKSAPGFDKDHWPYLASPDWMSEVNSFYQPERKPQDDASPDSRNRTPYGAWRASTLKGTDVKSVTGDKLGSLGDTAVDIHGRVSYVTLGMGGLLGIGEDHVAVPWSMLRFVLAPDKNAAPLVTLAATKKEVGKAVSFLEGKQHHTAMSAPSYIAGVYNYFEAKPYWQEETDGGAAPSRS